MSRLLVLLLLLVDFTPTIHGQEVVCIDSTHFNPQAACFAIYAPVCGCNGSLPGNSCEAYNWAALSCFDGRCPDASPQGCAVHISHSWSGDTLFLTDQSETASGDPIISYTWERNYTAFANSPNTLLIKQPGDSSILVSLWITSQNGCVAYCTYRFDVNTSISQPEELIGVHTFPNPVTGSLQILFDQHQEAGMLILTDMLGRAEEVTQWSGGNRAEMDVSDIYPGMYILILQQGLDHHVLDRVQIVR